jgi:hypothetical protein
LKANKGALVKPECQRHPKLGKHQGYEQKNQWGYNPVSQLSHAQLQVYDEYDEPEEKFRVFAD